MHTTDGALQGVGKVAPRGSAIEHQADGSPAMLTPRTAHASDTQVRQRCATGSAGGGCTTRRIGVCDHAAVVRPLRSRQFRMDGDRRRR